MESSPYHVGFGATGAESEVQPQMFKQGIGIRATGQSGDRYIGDE